MRISVLALFAICLLLIQFISCDESKVLQGPNRANPVLFPNDVGMYWTYEVYDSLTSSVDTVEVSVTNSFRSGSGNNVALFKYHFRQDQSYTLRAASVIDDTLVIYSDSINLIPEELFIYPLTFGKQWTGPFVNVNDSSQVTDSGKVTVPAGTFSGGVEVKRSWAVGFEGDGSFSSTWLVPNVGIVSRHYYITISDGSSITVTRNQTWKLIRYNLSTFNIDQFPSTVGSEWVYQSYDSSTQIYDTLYVSISDTLTVDANSATLWEYDYGGYVDTQYVVKDRRKSRITVSTVTRLGSLQDIYYEFPFTIGRHWGEFHLLPVPKITDKGRVAVDAGTFDNGFRYFYSGSSFNSFWYIDAWLVPDIGMVSWERGERNLGPMISTDWELISYNIAR